MFTFDLIIVLSLIVLNGVLAMSEAAIIAARKARLKQKVEEGNKNAEVALQLAEEPNRFLSTVQIGITLVGVLSGAFGGAALADDVNTLFRDIDLLAPYSEALALGLVVVTLTFLSLVIGELVPKRIALNNAEQIAMLTARPMRLVSRATSPIVSFLGLSTDVVLFLLGIKSSDDAPVTEEEIRIMMAQGAQAGVFEETEQEFVTNVLMLDDRRVVALMTPRHEIVWIDIQDDLEATYQKILASDHSRFPVYENTPENVMGILEVRKIWVQLVEKKNVDLRAVLTEPLYVPETTQVLDLLELLRESRRHLALVIDEFGNVEGLVTITDVLEAIVGDLPTHNRQIEEEIVRRDDGSWLVDGMVSVDSFKSKFDLKQLPNEQKGLYQTIGGFMMMYLERIPKASDSFEWENMRFEVMDMDGKRVDKVLVSMKQKEEMPEEK